MSATGTIKAEEVRAPGDGPVSIETTDSAQPAEGSSTGEGAVEMTKSAGKWNDFMPLCLS
jgi:hypothetical protein